MVAISKADKCFDLYEGRLLWGELSEAFAKAVGVERDHYLCRAETVQLSFEAKADQVKATQQRMLRHHQPGLLAER